MALATHLVGRTSELSSVDRLLAEVAEGRSAALELVGEPGIGKTRFLAELPHMRTPAGTSASRAGLGSSSETCRSGSLSTRSTSTFTASTHTGWTASTAMSGRNSRRSFRH